MESVNENSSNGNCIVQNEATISDDNIQDTNVDSQVLAHSQKQYNRRILTPVVVCGNPYLLPQANLNSPSETLYNDTCQSNGTNQIPNTTSQNDQQQQAIVSHQSPTICRNNSSSSVSQSETEKLTALNQYVLDAFNAAQLHPTEIESTSCPGSIIRFRKAWWAGVRPTTCERTCRHRSKICDAVQLCNDCTGYYCKWLADLVGIPVLKASGKVDNLIFYKDPLAKLYWEKISKVACCPNSTIKCLMCIRRYQLFTHFLPGNILFRELVYQSVMKLHKEGFSVDMGLIRKVTRRHLEKIAENMQLKLPIECLSSLQAYDIIVHKGPLVDVLRNNLSTAYTQPNNNTKIMNASNYIQSTSSGVGGTGYRSHDYSKYNANSNYTSTSIMNDYICLDQEKKNYNKLSSTDLSIYEHDIADVDQEISDRQSDYIEEKYFKDSAIDSSNLRVQDSPGSQYISKYDMSIKDRQQVKHSDSPDQAVLHQIIDQLNTLKNLGSPISTEKHIKDDSQLDSQCYSEDPNYQQDNYRNDKSGSRYPIRSKRHRVEKNSQPSMQQSNDHIENLSEPFKNYSNLSPEKKDMLSFVLKWIHNNDHTDQPEVPKQNESSTANTPGNSTILYVNEENEKFFHSSQLDEEERLARFGIRGVFWEPAKMSWCVLLPLLSPIDAPVHRRILSYPVKEWGSPDAAKWNAISERMKQNPAEWNSIESNFKLELAYSIKLYCARKPLLSTSNTLNCLDSSHSTRDTSTQEAFFSSTEDISISENQNEQKESEEGDFKVKDENRPATSRRLIDLLGSLANALGTNSNEQTSSLSSNHHEAVSNESDEYESPVFFPETTNFQSIIAATSPQ